MKELTETDWVFIRIWAFGLGAMITVVVVMELVFWFQRLKRRIKADWK